MVNGPTIEAINIRQRIALGDRDDVMPITSMYDCNGEKTDDPDLAVSFVAGPDSRTLWFVGRVDAFEHGKKAN